MPEALSNPLVQQAIATLATTVVVPLLLAAAKKLIPKLPKASLPVAAPLLGALVDVGTHYATGTSNPLLGALAGSAGVGLRELVDQLKKAGGASGITTGGATAGPIRPPS